MDPIHIQLWNSGKFRITHQFGILFHLLDCTHSPLDPTVELLPPTTLARPLFGKSLFKALTLRVSGTLTYHPFFIIGSLYKSTTAVLISTRVENYSLVANLVAL